MANMQDVQRLESEIIFPRVLENLITYDKQLLQQREILISTNKYKGNTQELKAYKSNLPKLSQQQLEYCVGLVLGDTTIQANNNVTAWRLKTQQTEKNVSLMFLIQIEASSFESFVTTVGPYILSNFQTRLPSPRKPNSRFKSNDT